MLVKEARAVVRRWVAEEASRLTGFRGAFFAGSTNWMPDDAALPPSSDVDVKIVLEGPEVPNTFSKFVYRDVMIEVSYELIDRIGAVDKVLGSYYLAGHFTTPSIILDPSGELAAIQAGVKQSFARRTWVVRRCEDVRAMLLNSIEWWDPSNPLHAQVFAWTYPISLPNHLMLVAALRNPTIRTMWVASGQVLATYGHAWLYEALLDLLGTARLSRAEVEALLAACVDVFDVAKEVVTTPFWGASNLSDFARPILVDGSAELIANGYHREAMFWILTTHAWCQKALQNDAPAEVQAAHMPSFEHLVDTLGIASSGAMQQRTTQLLALLPRIWEVSQEIVMANPALTD